MTASNAIRILDTCYLGVYGSVGSHPQFNCLNQPPAGYEFIHDDPLSAAQSSQFKRRAVKVSRLIHLLGPAGSVAIRGVIRGAAIGELMRFYVTRGGARSQAAIPISTPLAFVRSFPFILGQVPWVIEIEDTTTLFRPYIFNGDTVSLDLTKNKWFPFIKALLQSDSCRGIICHVKSCANSVSRLFASKALSAKTFYVPLGMSATSPLSLQVKDESDTVDILFTNSWNQAEQGFYARGGVDLLEAFAILRNKYPGLRLTLKTTLPRSLHRRYRDMIFDDWRIKVIESFVSDQQLERLMMAADIYVLPAARLHCVSILRAMAFSMALVVSDGWGINEYVRNEWNGLVVPGRYGQSSWIDESTGILREDYSSLRSKNQTCVDGLVDAISRLVEDRELRLRLARNGRSDLSTEYSMEKWNARLKRVLDVATRQDRPPGLKGDQNFHDVTDWKTDQ